MDADIFMIDLHRSFQSIIEYANTLVASQGETCGFIGQLASTTINSGLLMFKMEPESELFLKNWVLYHDSYGSRGVKWQDDQGWLQFTYLKYIENILSIPMPLDCTAPFKNWVVGAHTWVPNSFRNACFAKNLYLLGLLPEKLSIGKACILSGIDPRGRMNIHDWALKVVVNSRELMQILHYSHCVVGNVLTYHGKEHNNAIKAEWPNIVKRATAFPIGPGSLIGQDIRSGPEIYGQNGNVPVTPSVPNEPRIESTETKSNSDISIVNTSFSATHTNSTSFDESLLSYNDNGIMSLFPSLTNSSMEEGILVDSIKSRRHLRRQHKILVSTAIDRDTISSLSPVARIHAVYQWVKEFVLSILNTNSAVLKGTSTSTNEEEHRRRLDTTTISGKTVTRTIHNTHTLPRPPPKAMPAHPSPVKRSPVSAPHAGIPATETELIRGNCSSAVHDELTRTGKESHWMAQHPSWRVLEQTILAGNHTVYTPFRDKLRRGELL